MQWGYGVTSCALRIHGLLPQTLKSLAAAGFDRPRLFIDGQCQIPSALQGYEITHRIPAVRTSANWLLSALELLWRHPTAERFAIFQDDFTTYRNLRQYLEQLKFPAKGYWNCCLFPENIKPQQGWYLSNQKGRSAVALIFSNEGLRTLLSSRYLIDRPLDANRGWKRIDGGIVDAMKLAGWQEWVHNPTLVYHTGTLSSIGNKRQPEIPTFRGEDFDALELLKDKPSLPAVHTETSRRVKVGLVGYHCRTGLGELNRQIATYGGIERWLIYPHPRFKHEQPLPDLDSWIDHTGAKVERFVKSVDVLLFCERPFYGELVKYAKQHNKRLVCVPMQEWMPEGGKGWPRDVDLHLCPTQHCYDQFKDLLPCEYFRWPVDTNRFLFEPREHCMRFLFVNGHGGWKGRKGAAVVRAAKEIWPEMPLTVRSQRAEEWPHPEWTKVLTESASNADLYAAGDVLIAPHSVDGLGLEPMEAMACGLPVITTDGRPWNELPALARIPAAVQRTTVQREVDWYSPYPAQLAKICKSWIGRSIEQQSEAAGQWAGDNSWACRAEEFRQIIGSVVLR